uniref:Uncharacterized protein n=1 Tax=Cacopsylla melanoneura TaxID=428564 RepID=A0A8D9EHW1_9HEMI
MYTRLLKDAITWSIEIYKFSSNRMCQKCTTGLRDFGRSVTPRDSAVRLTTKDTTLQFQYVFLSLFIFSFRIILKLIDKANNMELHYVLSKNPHFVKSSDFVLFLHFCWTQILNSKMKRGEKTPK